MPDSTPASPTDPMFGNHASDLLNAALDGTQPISDPNHWEPPTAEKLQEHLSGYAVEVFLARGGMGAVYRGEQLSLGRKVAIKILPPYLSQSDPQYSERFKQEARAMAQLNHPAIVSVYDFGQMADGTLYFIMEYIDGTDVSQMVQKSGRLHSDHAMAITAHVCDALQYAHEHGVVHRDIKPANIMVGYDGRVKVADFGLAKSLTKKQQLSLTQTGFVMGTPHFLAPEAMMMGVSVDHRADIYAVGVMLYQMLTGRLPQGIFEMPSLQVPGLDPRYDQIIVSAMREDREQRFPSVLHMRRALDAILTQPIMRSEVAQQTVPPATVAPTSRQTPQQEQPAAAPKPQPGQHYYRPPQAAGASSAQTPRKGFPVMPLVAALIAVGGLYFVFKPSASKQPEVAASTEVPAVSPANTSPPQQSGQSPQTPPSTPAPTASPPSASIPTVASAPKPAPNPLPQSSGTRIELLLASGANFIGAVFAASMPEGLDQSLTRLNDDLVNEGRNQPVATMDTYRAAYAYVSALKAALDERKSSSVASWMNRSDVLRPNATELFMAFQKAFQAPPAPDQIKNVAADLDIGPLGQLKLRYMQFSGATVAEAMEYLQHKSRDLDPAKNGLKIHLSAAAAMSSTKLECNLVNITFADAIRYIALIARLDVSMAGQAVRLTPSANLRPPYPTQPGSSRITRQSGLTFPSVQFVGASLAEAVEYLRIKGRDLDPMKELVPILIDPDSATPASRITLSLQNVPLAEALRYSAEMAGVQPICLGDCFYLQPKVDSKPTKLATAAPTTSTPTPSAANTSNQPQPPKPLSPTEMKLKEPWMPHNIHTRKEWLAALDFYSKEVIKQGVRTPTTIWGSFTWLMPLKQATSLLPRGSYKLKTVTAAKLAYPEGISVEFWHVGGKGYEDNLEFFDEIAFVLDEASRLVSLQLGENSYKTLNWRWQDKGGPDGDRNPYYDFLNDSANGKNGRKVFYQFRPGPTGVTNVKLVLDESTSSHWYLTEPLAKKFTEIYAEVNKQGL